MADPSDSASSIAIRIGWSGSLSRIPTPSRLASPLPGKDCAAPTGRTAENEKAIGAFLEPDTIKTIYLHGHPDPEKISPDNWSVDNHFLERPNARQVQLDFFYDYRTNVDLYPKWQAFLREKQPETIIFWGQNDIFFTKEGGEAFLQVLPKAEMHRLQSGHFALEDCLDEIAGKMSAFYRALK